MAQHVAFSRPLRIEDAVRYLRAVSHVIAADLPTADTLVERALEDAILSGSLPDLDRVSLGRLYKHLRVYLQELPPPLQNSGQTAAPCLPYDYREVLILQMGIGLSVKEISGLLEQPPERVSRKLRDAQELLCKPCWDVFACPRAA